MSSDYVHSLAGQAQDINVLQQLHSQLGELHLRESQSGETTPRVQFGDGVVVGGGGAGGAGSICGEVGRSTYGANISLRYYPVDFPKRDLLLLTAVLLQRQQAEYRAVAASAYRVQGYLMGLTLGEPDESSVPSVLSNGQGARPLSNREATTLMLQLVSLESLPQAAWFGDVASVVRSQLAAILIPILLDWIRSYLLDQGGLERLIDSIAAS
jgi:hypothetical protein